MLTQYKLGHSTGLKTKLISWGEGASSPKSQYICGFYLTVWQSLVFESVCTLFLFKLLDIPVVWFWETSVLSGGWVPDTSGSAERDYLMPCDRVKLPDEKWGHVLQALLGPLVKVLQALEGSWVGGTWVVLQSAAASPAILSSYSHDKKRPGCYSVCW